jgi:hypothetical protein
MSFESTYEFARWTLHFVAGQIRMRRFDSCAQPGPALPVSNLTESVNAVDVQNTRVTHDRVPLSQTGARKKSEWTYRRKYLLSSKPGWTRQAVDAWENEGGSRRNPGVTTEDSNKEF